jgi:hypothetical protein
MHVGTSVEQPANVRLQRALESRLLHLIPVLLSAKLMLKPSNVCEQTRSSRRSERILVSWSTLRAAKAMASMFHMAHQPNAVRSDVDNKRPGRNS